MAKAGAWTGAMLLVALVCVAINLPSRSYDFVYDDLKVVAERPPVSETGWKEFWATRHWGLSRQLTLLSFDANHGSPLDPAPYHATNIALAALIAVLVGLLAAELGADVATSGLAGLLFALHPGHVDAVAAVVGRAELLAALFVVLACLADLRACRRGRERSPGHLVLLGSCYLAGLFSKEHAIMMPALVMLGRLFVVRTAVPGSYLAEGLRTALPFGLAMAAWLPFAAYHSGDLSPIAYVDNPLAFAGSADRGAAAAEILWRYAALLLVPWPLLPDRSFASTPATALAGPVAALGWLAVVGIVLAGRRRRPLLAWAVLWFALAFLPTSNLLFPTGTIMAERLLFLPSVGPLVWLACTLGCLGRKTAGRPVPRVLFASFLLAAGTAFSVAYLDRAEAWRDSATFHARAVAAAPRSAKAHYDAGLYYQREADWSSAEAEFRRALAIVPRFAAAVGQLAEGLARERNPLEGLAVYETYLAVEPSDEAALANAIRLGLVSGRSRRVLPLAKRLTELAPENGEYKALLDYVEGFRTGARRQFSP